jgi:hypothetical protein
MALPVLNTPKFELTLPSTKKKYKYRPFLAKEEKVLLIAMEGGDDKEIVNAIKDIISVCVEKIDVESLPLFDIEYVFLKLREKSIGDTIIFYVKHQDPTSECKHRQEVKINLSDVNVYFDEEHTNKIQLDSKIGLVLKYPTMSLAEEIESMDTDNVDSVFNMIKKSIDYVYDAENTYTDFTPKELDDFIGSWSHTQLEAVNKFFETMPMLKYDIVWKCEKCGKEETVSIEGISNFFT